MLTRIGTSSHRICSGYATVTRSSSPLASTLTFRNSRCDVSCEIRSLQFFVERTMRQLATFFPDDLFSTRVLQVAHLEPSIWHALVALSTYHERFLEHGPGPVPRESLFGLRQYNKAIEGLLSSRPSLPLVRLVSCTIFICIEVRCPSRPLFCH